MSNDRTPAVIRATRSGRWWIASAVALVAVNLLAYLLWRPGQEAVGSLLIGSMWFCFARWSNERGFLRGWYARGGE